MVGLVGWWIGWWVGGMFTADAAGCRLQAAGSFLLLAAAAAGLIFGTFELPTKTHTRMQKTQTNQSEIQITSDTIVF